MLNKRTWILLAAVVATCLMMAGQVISQETPQRRPAGQGEARERARGRMREALGVSEEQWKVLAPKIEKIEALKRDAGETLPGRAPRRDVEGPASAPAGEQLSDAQQKTQALREILNKTDAAPEQIKDALKALRKARDQARKDLTAARKDLLKSLDARQEARLVLMGILQ